MSNVLDFRKTPSLFNSLFKELIEWTKTTEDFQYNVITTTVDYKVKYINLVNPNKLGNYYVTTENKIYDQDSIELIQLNKLDKVTISGKDYYLDDFYILREIGEKWNNSVLGRYGLSVFFGDVYDENIEQCPQFYMIFDSENNLSPLEKTYTSIEKTLEFIIDFIVDVDDVFSSGICYNATDFYSDKFMELIFRYFNECHSVTQSARRVTDWRQNLINRNETKPIIRQGLLNTLTYY